MRSCSRVCITRSDHHFPRLQNTHSYTGNQYSVTYPDGIFARSPAYPGSQSWLMRRICSSNDLQEQWRGCISGAIENGNPLRMIQIARERCFRHPGAVKRDDFCNGAHSQPNSYCRIPRQAKTTRGLAGNCGIAYPCSSFAC